MTEILLLFTNKRKEPTDKDMPESLAQRMAEYMNGLGSGANYSYAIFEDLVHKMDGNKPSIIDAATGRDIADYDVVYQRQYAMAPEEAAACAIYLTKKGIPVVDSESNSLGFWGKLTGNWRLWDASLPMPKTFFVGSRQAENWVEKSMESELSFPAIMKSNYGRRGRDNHLVQSKKQALEYLKKSKNPSYIFQEYVPSSHGYRIWVCGEEAVLAIERRQAPDSHLNNAAGSVGRKVKLSDLPEKMLEEAVLAAKSVGRQIAGVDVIVSEDDPSRYVFLEVNRAPQLFTRVNAKYKAAAMDKYLRSIAKR